MCTDIKSVRSLQDIHYDEQPCAHRNKCLLPTLAELCAQEIVKDVYLVKRFLPFLPCQLHLLIMKVAILKGRLSSVQVLLEGWPTETFSLTSLCKELHTLGSECLDLAVYKAYMHSWCCCLLTLFKVFIKLIATKSTAKLKTLDLGVLPAGDKIVNTVVTSINNFFQRRKDASSFRKRKRSEESFDSSPFQTDAGNLFEDEKYSDFPYNLDTHKSYVLKMYCTVCEKETVDKLCSAISLSQMPSSPLKIFISRLDISTCGLNVVKRVLNLMHANYLVGLALPFNGFTGENLTKLAPEVIKFSKLTSLNLSNNNINFIRDFKALSALKDILASLESLCRLDLGSNKLSGCLRLIYCEDNLVPPYYNTDKDCEVMAKLFSASSRESGLQYLSLLGCHVITSDLHYLANSRHCRTLRDLDLSENNLASQIDSLTILLKAISKQIRVLELENCHFTIVELDVLMKCFSEMKQLWWLNLARHEFPSTPLCEQLINLSHLPELQYIQLSYPTDCYDENNTFISLNQLKKNVLKCFRSATSTETFPVNICWIE